MPQHAATGLGGVSTGLGKMGKDRTHAILLITMPQKIEDTKDFLLMARKKCVKSVNTKSKGSVRLCSGYPDNARTL